MKPEDYVHINSLCIDIVFMPFIVGMQFYGTSTPWVWACDMKTRCRVGWRPEEEKHQDVFETKALLVGDDRKVTCPGCIRRLNEPSLLVRLDEIRSYRPEPA